MNIHVPTPSIAQKTTFLKVVHMSIHSILDAIYYNTDDVKIQFFKEFLSKYYQLDIPNDDNDLKRIALNKFVDFYRSDLANALTLYQTESIIQFVKKNLIK